MTASVDDPQVLSRFHSNLDLVDLIARQVCRELGRLVELDDLQSLGRQGLLEAARRFDESRGVSFRRFANYRVRGAMLDGVRKGAPLPRRVHARLRSLEAGLLVSESAAEDAQHRTLDAQASDQRLTEHLADLATAMAMGLLPQPVYNSDEGELSAVDPAQTPEEALARAELRKLVLEALADLPDDERTLVRRHYLEGERFDHVAESLGLSKSWGSRLHTRAIARLTKRLRSLAR